MERYITDLETLGASLRQALKSDNRLEVQQLCELAIRALPYSRTVPAVVLDYLARGCAYTSGHMFNAIWQAVPAEGLPCNRNLTVAEQAHLDMVRALWYDHQNDAAQALRYLGFVEQEAERLDEEDLKEAVTILKRKRASVS